jgi:serine/threonine protein kinase
LFIFSKIKEFSHKLHVVHRDLKPENVVFFERLSMVKLTDFGFSNHFTPGEQLQTSCGSLGSPSNFNKLLLQMKNPQILVEERKQWKNGNVK